MKIYLGADHRGFHLKAKIAAYLAKRGYDVEDVGDEVLNPNDDFPQFGQAAALRVIGSDDTDPRAILVCGGGQGMAMAANRFRGIRAIVVSTSEDTRLGRNDNDANVLSLPANLFDNDEDQYWQDIVDTFLMTEFAGAARFRRRNRELDELT